MLQYPARIHREEDVIWLEFIDLPTCFTQGETIEELKKNAREALSLHLHCMLEDNDEIPDPSNLQGKEIILVQPYYEVALPIMIKKRRKELNMSQKQAAEKMKVPYQTYQKIERGQRVNPTLKTLQKVARALGRTLILDFV